MANKDAQQIAKTVAGLMKQATGRNKDIIARRFGLTSGKKETLESIGKSYGITRERVRQIEEFTLGQLAKATIGNKDVERYLGVTRAIVSREGGVLKERELFKAFSGSDKESVANACLVFLLTLSRECVRASDSDHFYAFWALNAAHRDTFTGAVGSLVSALEKQKSVVPHGSFLTLAQQGGVKSPDGSSVSEKTLATLMAISKDISMNIYREVGLTTWPEVRPKGVRDKAYLVVKKAGDPRHFSEIAKLINTASFSDNKKVNVQTVHNELIKDSRFVLVGRGMYALSEWGYKAGTVKDVLVDVLKNASKPLTRTELVAKVMNVRMVKENTILLNLQDSSSFARNADGTYVLRKA